MKEWFMSWFMSDWTPIGLLIGITILAIVAIILRMQPTTGKMGCPQCGKEVRVKVPGSGEGIFQTDKDLENRCDRCDYDLNELL